jgi:hypothetical protein
VPQLGRDDRALVEARRERHEREDRRDRGHEDRPEAGVAALHERVVGRHALALQPLDEIEQDDRVRHDDADEHQEPDERAEPDRRSVSSSAGNAPIVASGRLNRMMNGVTSELNARTIIR